MSVGNSCLGKKIDNMLAAQSSAQVARGPQLSSRSMGSGRCAPTAGLRAEIARDRAVPSPFVHLLCGSKAARACTL